MTRARARSSRTPSRGTMSSSRIQSGRGYGDYKRRGRAVTRVQRALDVFFLFFFFLDVFANASPSPSPSLDAGAAADSARARFNRLRSALLM